MKRQKQSLVEQLKRRKCKLRNHKTSKVEQLKGRRYSQRNHRNLEEGVRKKKTIENSRIGKGGGPFNTRIRSIQDIISRNKTIY
jgi:hypothetical protein